MRNCFVCLAAILLTTVALSGELSIPWQISFPFFKNAQAPHSVIEGYGDWCVIGEGAHPGLDFGAITGDSVLVPADTPMYAIQIFLGDLGSSLVFGIDSTSQEGWGITHLSIPRPELWADSIPKAVADHQPLAPCSLYSPSAPLHMHLQWLDNLQGGSPPGLYNPFDFFTDNLSDYDEIQFNHVKWEEFLFPAGNRGIWFTPDGFETYMQLGYAPGNPNRNLFQSILSGAVDIAVAPFSAFQGLSDRDSAGVYSVSYQILSQNPNTLAYEPAAPDSGNYGERFLMEMRDEIPSGDSPGYRALFPDGHLTNGGGAKDPYWDYNMNAYIVTNSGAAEPSSWANGWSNVYTASGYTNDWVGGICQGAWDTFLAKPEYSGNPISNRQAFFPDGRYAVEVTAVS
ncbi:MAG: hypothetical protein J7K88_03090, partial [Candidatus Fermentibacteraceae bacterium]|nr:hypothetical protein [Candidatus Fermentibacteraceae bacterium]